MAHRWAIYERDCEPTLSPCSCSIVVGTTGINQEAAITQAPDFSANPSGFSKNSYLSFLFWPVFPGFGVELRFHRWALGSANCFGFAVTSHVIHFLDTSVDTTQYPESRQTNSCFIRHTAAGGDHNAILHCNTHLHGRDLVNLHYIIPRSLSKSKKNKKNIRFS